MNSALFDFELDILSKGDNVISFFAGKKTSEEDHSKWLKSYLDLLEICGTIVILPRWRESDGSADEVEKAINLDLKMIFEEEES